MENDDGRKLQRDSMIACAAARHELAREAMREALDLTIAQATKARREEENDWAQGLQLRMASRALRCALELYLTLHGAEADEDDRP